MISVREAERLIHRHAPERSILHAPIERAALNVLASDIRGERDYPPFHRAERDGLALFVEATTIFPKGQSWPVHHIARAGEAQTHLPTPQDACEIMTGTPLPTHANAIIMIEDLRIHDNVATLIHELEVVPFRYVHRRSSDYQANDVLLTQGTRLRSVEIGILASNGVSMVPIFSFPNVAIVSTGDEIVSISAPLQSHEIRASNLYAIEAELHSFGITRTERVHIPDDPTLIDERLQELMTIYPIIILTGGVSKGKFDYLPSIFHQLHVETVFHGVQQKPGKPMFFGVGSKGTHIYALPGNPVSALITLRRYVIPVLLGTPACALNHDGFTRFELIKNEKIIPLRSSGDFHTLTSTDGFVEMSDSGARGSVFYWGHP